MDRLAAALIAVAALAPLPRVMAIETGFQALVADRDGSARQVDAATIERRISAGSLRDVRDHPGSGEAWGRALRGIGFAAVAIFAVYGFRRDRRIELCVALAGAAVSLEVLQGLTATCVPDVAGAAINVLGAAAGGGLGVLCLMPHKAARRLRRAAVWAVASVAAGVVWPEAVLWLAFPVPNPFTTATVRSVPQQQSLPGLPPSIVGLYNSYARIPTWLRAKVIGVLGHRIDYVVGNRIHDARKAEIWIRDQYYNPHETWHSIGELLKWFEENGVEYLNCSPGILGTTGEDAPELFSATDPGTPYQRAVTQLSWLATIAREGALFDVIGRRRAT